MRKKFKTDNDGRPTGSAVDLEAVQDEARAAVASIVCQRQMVKIANSAGTTLKEIVEGMALGLAGKMKAAEPERFSEAAEALVETLELREVCMQSVLHYRKVMEVQAPSAIDRKS